MSTLLEAKARSNDRHSQLSELREKGHIPGVVYGYKVEDTPISVSGKDFLKVMREVGRNGVISLDLEGKKLNVLLHEYQEDPLRKEVIHTDFLVVDLNQEIEALVRVDLSEETAGVKNGGVLQHILHEISITAKPDEIPEVIQVDTSKLEIGESITIGDVKGNYSVVFNHEDDEQIASVAPPREETEEADAEANEEEPATE